MSLTGNIKSTVHRHARQHRIAGAFWRILLFVTLTNVAADSSFKEAEAASSVSRGFAKPRGRARARRAGAASVQRCVRG